MMVHLLYVYWAVGYIIIWRKFILERAIFVISVHTLLAIFILNNYGQIFFFFCLNVPSENTYVNFQKFVFQGKIREKK